MAGMKKGLGRGLDSLITAGSDLLNSEAKEVVEKAVTTVDIYSVEPDRDQPRKEFDDEKLEELAPVEAAPEKSEAELLIERLRIIQKELPAHREPETSEEEAAFDEAAMEQREQLWGAYRNRPHLRR